MRSAVGFEIEGMSEERNRKGLGTFGDMQAAYMILRLVEANVPIKRLSRVSLVPLDDPVGLIWALMQAAYAPSTNDRRLCWCPDPLSSVFSIFVSSLAHTRGLGTR